MIRVAFLLLALTIATPAMAERPFDPFNPSPIIGEKNSIFDDTYNGSNNLCGSDCARQDRIIEDDPSRPHQIENSFNTGRKAPTVSGIITNMLEPSGGR